MTASAAVAGAVAMSAALAAAAPASTPARDARDPALQDRVVFCAAGTDPCATAGKTLGTSARGFWALVGDQALLASPTPVLPVVYFSADDYQRAIAGLDARARAQAVLHRLDLVSADPAPRLFGRLQADLLQIAAATAERGTADLGLLLDAAAIAGGGDDRLRGTPLTAVLKEARESLAGLTAETPGGSAADGYGKEAAALAQLEVDVQHDPRLSVMPFAEPEPAYFVTPTPRPTYRELQQLGRPVFPWRGGVVTTLTPHELAQSPWKERAPRMLYAGRAPFLDDMMSLTDAQMDRRLRERLASGVGRQERLDFVAARAFDHAVRLRLLTYPLREARFPSLPRWSAVVTLDDANLRLALASAQPRAGQQRSVRVARLRADLALATRILRGAPHADRHLAAITRLDTLIARLSD